MIEKILKLMRTHVGAERICVFLVAFVAVISVISGVAVENTEQSSNPVSANINQNAAAEAIFTAQNLPETTGVLASKKKVEISEIPAVQDNAEDKNQKEKTESKSLAAQPGKFVYSDKIPMSYELQEYTYEKCVERGLEYELVLAIMWRESRFQTDAVNINTNGTRDSGIMQINDVNRKWLYEKYGVDDLMDPYQNINAGTAMLGTFVSKYGTHGALMAYQYGEEGMLRRLRQGQTTNRVIELAYNQRDYYRQIT